MQVMRSNTALNRDAPCLSRPLQGKGRASRRRAGKRERYTALMALTGFFHLANT